MSYIELHCHSHYSLLDGASSPDDLVAHAAEVGMPALALTDHNAVYGAVHFAQIAQSQGIRPIFGAEMTLANGHHLTLLVENQTGWHNLCRLISQAQRDRPKGEAALASLAGQTDGLIALSGCRQGEITSALLSKDRAAALSIARRYQALFGPENFWIELQHHLLPDDTTLVSELVELADYAGIGYVATNNVHYATPSARRLQDVLVCIRHHLSLEEAGPLLRRNSEYYLKSAADLRPRFAAYPAALSNTLKIAERCRFTPQYGLQELPRFLTPPQQTAASYLHQLCQAALLPAYPAGADRAREQLAHELSIIEQAGLANYFLIVWDLVRFASERGIRCQGRGSAANSLVAYLLDISPVDPLDHELVFERFLSAERTLAPDIDLDFEATKRREEVIQYIYQRYGESHAAMACTFVTFQKRSALRDIAKVLGISGPLLQKAADTLAGLESAPTDENRESPLGLLLELCQQIHHCPRHLGLHNGGMIITGSPLAERVPTEPAAMPGRVVVQWDKEALERVGLVKIDILGLRMLSALAETVKLIQESTGQAPDLDNLALTDPAVYALISQADTIGVFQVESRAQTQILPKLKPACFNDLIIAISLIRPGPIQGNMVRPYLHRRLGLEKVSYAHPLLENALSETLGVILFQEQVLKVARDLAGFTPGQGEQLRRVLGSKRAAVEIDRFRQAFITGAQARGVSADIAETVFELLSAFGSYSFAKSHAAAFAVLVYQSAWLKRYYPAQLYCALLNNQPMGFWNPAVLAGDARRHGIPILPVDLQASQGRCAVQDQAIRLGFNYVDGFGEASITCLETARQERPFSDLADLCRRTRLPRRLLGRLIMVGALDSWGLPRRRLLWELGQLHYQEDELELVFPSEAVELPPLTPTEAMAQEHAILGLSTGEHVLARYQPWLSGQGILGTQALKWEPDGQQVRLAGLLVVHQSPPTAKNYHFLTLEDGEGLVDVIVRPVIYARYRRLLQNTSLLIVEGIVQQQDGVTNLLAERLAVLSPISC
jgi:error-prone DNA polymerase